MHHPSAEAKVLTGSRAALEKKAFDLVAFDLRGISDMADFFLICTGTTDRHVRAIADAVEEALRHDGVKLDHKEGYLESTWILLDYGDIVIHIFTEEKREYYDLERLWGDAKRLDLSASVPENYQEKKESS
ncbi:MAG: ribosome silencing factor [bacterium]